MLWTDAAVAEMTTRMSQLGLRTCAICGSESLGADRRPIVLTVGGLPGQPGDSTTNALFMVRVQCELCGSSLLFNSEKFVSGDTPSLVFDG